MMGVCRDVGKLEPETRARVTVALATLEKSGVRYFISETLRSPEIQAAYYAQGREALEVVNQKRRAAGLWAIGDPENRKPITWTLQSRHILGEAIDIVPAKRNGDPDWGAPRAAYEKIASAFKAQGLEWGGDWEPAKQDLPHYQLRHA
jgi:hypothetical protein